MPRPTSEDQYVDLIERVLGDVQVSIDDEPRVDGLKAQTTKEPEANVFDDRDRTRP